VGAGAFADADDSRKLSAIKQEIERIQEKNICGAPRQGHLLSGSWFPYNSSSRRTNLKNPRRIRSVHLAFTIETITHRTSIS